MHSVITFRSESDNRVIFSHKTRVHDIEVPNVLPACLFEFVVVANPGEGRISSFTKGKVHGK